MKEEKQDLEEKLMRESLKQTGITQDEIDAVDNAITSCREMINYYLDNIPPVGNIRKQMLDLSLECDRVTLDKVAFDLDISEASTIIKTNVLLKQDKKFDGNKLRKQLDKIKKQSSELVQKLSASLEEVAEKGY